MITKKCLLRERVLAHLTTFVTLRGTPFINTFLFDYTFYLLVLLAVFLYDFDCAVYIVLTDIRCEADSEHTALILQF